MNWLKKQWRGLMITIGCLIGGMTGGIFIGGQHVDVIPSKGIHSITPFTNNPIYANDGKPFPLESGQRYINIGIVKNIANDSILFAFADTLDNTGNVGLDINQKFTQNKR